MAYGIECHVIRTHLLHRPVRLHRPRRRPLHRRHRTHRGIVIIDTIDTTPIVVAITTIIIMIMTTPVYFPIFY